MRAKIGEKHFYKNAFVALKNKRYADAANIYAGFISKARAIQIYMDKFNNYKLVDYLCKFKRARISHNLSKKELLFETLNEAIKFTNKYAIFFEQLSFFYKNEMKAVIPRPASK